MQSKQIDNFLFRFVLMHSFLAGNNLRTFVKFQGLLLHTNSIMNSFDKQIANVGFNKCILITKS